jgi:hypothetical protein
MKNFCCVFALCLLCVAGVFAQKDTSRNMVKYSRDFKFQDGIFMNFLEFKNNAPSIKKFEVVKDKSSFDEGDMTLYFSATDTLGNTKEMTVLKCFGFSKNGVLYFSNGNNGFYRMFIVGALSHFMQYQPSSRYVDDYYGDPSMLTWSANDLKEYVLDLKTGGSFLFTYRNFKDFLKSHDEELLKELEKSKNKRDMIHHFLLKYNEKHPVYFPYK